MRQSGFFPVIGERRSYHPHETGLQGLIVTAVPCEETLLGPHLKVEALRDSVTASVTISNHPYIIEGSLSPRVGRRVFSFIRSNRLVLQALWNEAISGSDAAQRFRKG